MDDDDELLARAAAGDRYAFTAFVRRWERPLFRFLERTLGSAHLADEARQITFVRVLERGAAFRGGSAAAWLFRVGFRAALDLRRREKVRRGVPFEATAAIADRGEGPADKVAGDDERAFVRTALAAMEPQDRAILWLRIADGRTFASVAQTLDLPESTVRLQFVRALARLKRRLTSGVPKMLEVTDGVR